MTTKQIKVGQNYRHVDYPSTTYLGIGNRQTNGEFLKKNLVIISDTEDNQWVGSIVYSPKNNQKFWEGFYEA